MPELPEVETIKEALRKAVEGAVIQKVIVRNRKFRIPVPADFEDTLEGAAILKVYRIAKYAVLDLDNGFSVVWHFGMSGKVKITDTYPADLEKHDHIIIVTTRGILTFNDARRFGLMTCLKTSNLRTCSLFSHTGPDPFDEQFNADYFSAKLCHKKTAIKIALLDQSIVNGIGNIYASEALYAPRISPLRECCSLSKQEISNLINAVRKTLQKAIDAGGSTLRDYRKPDGSMGYFQHMHCVYGKAGQKCPDCSCNGCTEGIKKIIQGGRSTFYCRHLQK